MHVELHVSLHVPVYILFTCSSICESVHFGALTGRSKSCLRRVIQLIEKIPVPTTWDSKKEWQVGGFNPLETYYIYIVKLDHVPGGENET